MSIIFAPLDDPAREHGLTLHKVGRVRRGHTPPTPMLQVSGSDDEDALDKALSAEPPVYTKAMKRASSISILSGLGVNLEKSSATAGGANQEGPSSPTSAVNSASPTKTFRKGPSKLRNFFGQRPRASSSQTTSRSTSRSRRSVCSSGRGARASCGRAACPEGATASSRLT